MCEGAGVEVADGTYVIEHGDSLSCTLAAVSHPGGDELRFGSSAPCFVKREKIGLEHSSWRLPVSGCEKLPK